MRYVLLAPHGGRRSANSVGQFDRSGAVLPKPSTRKKDLRTLGEWIAAKRKAEEISRQESELAVQIGQGKSRKS